MIQVKLFARARELSPQGDLKVSWRQGLTVAALHADLSARSERHAAALAGPLFAALNHDMVGFETHIEDGDEVAFFPPVTGG